MTAPKVSDFEFTSVDGGIFVITVRRRPEVTAGMLGKRSPDPQDVPADIAEAIKVWLAGNQS